MYKGIDDVCVMAVAHIAGFLNCEGTSCCCDCDQHYLLQDGQSHYFAKLCWGAVVCFEFHDDVAFILEVLMAVSFLPQLVTWLENVLHTQIVHKCNITKNIRAHASADKFFSLLICCTAEHI